MTGEVRESRGRDDNSWDRLDAFERAASQEGGRGGRGRLFLAAGKRRGSAKDLSLPSCLYVCEYITGQGMRRNEHHLASGALVAGRLEQGRPAHDGRLLPRLDIENLSSLFGKVDSEDSAARAQKTLTRRDCSQPWLLMKNDEQQATARSVGAAERGAAPCRWKECRQSAPVGHGVLEDLGIVFPELQPPSSSADDPPLHGLARQALIWTFLCE